jgi:hypothetical protein
MQRTFDASYERICLERLLEHAYRPAGEGSKLDLGPGTSRDHDGRRIETLRAEMPFQFDAAHTRHLDVGHETGQTVHFPVQEIFRRTETASHIAARTQKPDQGDAQGFVVIDDHNKGGGIQNRFQTGTWT